MLGVIFKRTDRLLKTDTVYVARGGFWLGTGQAVAMLTGFLLATAFANLLPQNTFGNYKYILSVARILGAFSLSQIGVAVTQATARGFGGALTQGFRTNLRWSGGMLLGVLALVAYYFIRGNALLSASFLMVGIATPVIASANLYIAYLSGKKDFKTMALYGMIHTTLPAAALITTLFLTKSLLAIIVVYFLSQAAVSFYLYQRTARLYRYESTGEDPELVSYSKHLSIMDWIGIIAQQVDKILVFHFLGAAQLAIYAFATAPVDQLQSGKKILRALSLPKMSKRSFGELQSSGARKEFFLVAYALVLAGIYALLAPYFYEFFFPQYLDSVFYSQVYSLTLLAISGTLFGQTLVAHKKKKELYILRIIVPIVEIILFLALLPLYGLMGLIATRIFIKVFSSFLSFYFVKFPLGNVGNADSPSAPTS